MLLKNLPTPKFLAVYQLFKFEHRFLLNYQNGKDGIV